MHLSSGYVVCLARVGVRKEGLLLGKFVSRGNGVYSMNACAPALWCLLLVSLVVMQDNFGSACCSEMAMKELRDPLFGAPVFVFMVLSRRWR